MRTEDSHKYWQMAAALLFFFWLTVAGALLVRYTGF